MDLRFNYILKAVQRLRRGKSPYCWEVRKILYEAGWNEERDDVFAEQEYQRQLADSWVPTVGKFVRSFGYLNIGHNSLWVYPEKALVDLNQRSRIERIIKCACCPVAVSGYTGDTGGTLWIDAVQRFYYLDKEGLIFLGGNAAEALRVLLIRGSKPPLPPEDLRTSLAQAYEWNK